MAENPIDETSMDESSIDDANTPLTDALFATNFVILQRFIKELEDTNARRSHSNIIDKFKSMNIGELLAERVIQHALDKNLITSYRYSQQINYRVQASTSQAAVIRDPVEDKGTSTTEVQYVTTNEFNDFKNSVLQEINIISHQNPINISHQNPIVDTLLKHIEFLQNTITKLVESKNLPVPVCLHASPQTTNSSDSKPSPLSTIKHQSPPPAQLLKTPSIALTIPTHSKAAASSDTPPIETAAPETASQPSERRQDNNARNNQMRKQVLIVGDSMLNVINEQDLRRDAFVRVRNHPGATIEDLIDHVRAHTRHVKHDGVIIMAGTNDISLNNLDENKSKPNRPTTTHLSELIKELKQTLPAESHVAICQITARKDSAKAMQGVNKLNAEFKLLAEREHIGYVNTSHFTKDHTGKKGVHPNERGLDELHNTFEKYVHKISRL